MLLVVVVAAIWPVSILTASVAGSNEFDTMRMHCLEARISAR